MLTRKFFGVENASMLEIFINNLKMKEGQELVLHLQDIEFNLLSRFVDMFNDAAGYTTNTINKKIKEIGETKENGKIDAGECSHIISSACIAFQFLIEMSCRCIGLMKKQHAQQGGGLLPSLNPLTESMMDNINDGALDELTATAKEDAIIIKLVDGNNAELELKLNNFDIHPLYSEGPKSFFFDVSNDRGKANIPSGAEVQKELQN